MRTVEDLSALALAVVGASLLWPGARSGWGVRAAWMAGLPFLLAQFFLVGPHWQMFPLYLAALMLTTLVIVRRPLSSRTARVAGLASLLLIGASIVFAYLLPMFSLPQPSGEFPVGTTVLYMRDGSRKEVHTNPPRDGREVVIQIWYPARHSHAAFAPYRRWAETTPISSYMAILKTHSRRDAPVANGFFPVLLFNPAWTGQRTQNTFQTEDLASHGFVVVGIDHPYNSQIIAFPDGRRMNARHVRDIDDFTHSSLAGQIAMADAESDYEAEDNVSVLNFLAAMNRDPKSDFYGRIDCNRAGAFGHSFGGAVSMETARRDARVKGALNLDGWVFGDVALAGLAKPLMIITRDGPDPTPADLNSTNRTHRLSSQLTQWDDDNVERSLRTYGGFLVILQGAKHMNFCDRALYSPLRRLTDAGAIDPVRAHRIVETYTLAFFSGLLQGAEEPILSGKTHPFPEARCIVYRPEERSPEAASGAGARH